MLASAPKSFDTAWKMVRAELQKVLDAPLDPEYTPEDKDWKAQEMLRTLR